MGWFSGRHEELLTLLAERQRVLEQALEGVLVEVHEIKTALVVRDPGNRLSADAYQGLRQAVMAGANARRTHLVQLAQIADAVRGGADSSELSSLVEEWVIQAGLTQVDDPKTPALYEIIDGAGEALRVRQPAWVDTHTGALIRRGTAERIPAPPKASISPTATDGQEASEVGEPTPTPDITDAPASEGVVSEPTSPASQDVVEDAVEAAPEHSDAAPEAPGDTSEHGVDGVMGSPESEGTTTEQPAANRAQESPDESSADAPTDGKDQS